MWVLANIISPYLAAKCHFSSDIPKVLPLLKTNEPHLVWTEAKVDERDVPSAIYNITCS